MAGGAGPGLDAALNGGKIRIRAATVLCALAVVGAAPRALAIPALARRYGVACDYCHQGYPKLNPIGPQVIVAGGGASLDDVREARSAGLAGAIIGRAIHEGRFSLEEAIACSQS